MWPRKDGQGVLSREMTGSLVGTKKMVYWLTRVTACELTVGISSPTLRSVMSHGSLEIGHHGSIYTTEMGKYYRQGFLCFVFLFTSTSLGQRFLSV